MTGSHPSQLAVLEREGLRLSDLANLDARIRDSAAMEMLEDAIRRGNPPSLGLLAGEALRPGDFDVIEDVARCVGTLRESIRCSNRYLVLVHDALEGRLEESGQLATWHFSTVDSVLHPHAANDFIVSAAAWFLRTRTGIRFPLREIHLRHQEPHHLSEYARVFDQVPIRFGMHHNAVSFDRDFLKLPLRLANEALAHAFHSRVESLLELRRKSLSLTARVSACIAEHISSKRAGISFVADQLHTTEPTLRRHLAAEGQSFMTILEKVRLRLASGYLADVPLPIREVSLRLGFSHVPAFHRFLVRRTGLTPAQLRKRLHARSAIHCFDGRGSAAT